jgi:hypothetical protein
VRLVLVAVVVAIAAALPSIASAHVGRTLPVATSFTARITGPVQGIRARVVDGDQTLWLQTAAVVLVVGAALVYGLVNRDESTRVSTAFLVGFGGLYEGLTMLPLLMHAIVLSDLPSAVARVGEVLIIGAGIGVLAGSILGQLRVSEAGIDSSGAA